jgi:Ca-activated chloride channel family protein
MKITKYGKYTGELSDEIDLDELMKRLGDFFLQSGFESQYYGLSEFDSAQSM